MLSADSRPILLFDKTHMTSYFDFKKNIKNDILEAVLKTMTIRGVDPSVSAKLKSKAAEQGKSVNQMTIELIKKGLGLEKEKVYSRQYDDLDALFGRWSDDEYNAIQSKIDRERQIDAELW